MPDTTVKYLHSAMPGAPVLNGTAGAMIGVLDACLVNGFGLKTVDSIVVAGGQATANISTGHSLEPGAVAFIAGAPAALLGEQRVTSITANTVVWTTTAADQTINTAGMTIKLAPAGWVKSFAGVNKSAYKSINPAASGFCVRVDDTAAQVARLTAFEVMTDIDTGTGMFPTAAQRPGGTWWAKSNAANATARAWMLVSDGRIFYLMREFANTFSGAYESACFGDILPPQSGIPMAYGCILSGQASDTSALTPGSAADNLHFSSGATAVDLFCARSYVGLGGSRQLVKSFGAMFCGSISGHSGANATCPPFPNPVDGGLYVSLGALAESGSLVLRGMLPGLFFVPQNVPVGLFSPRDSVIAVSGYPGRLFKVCTSYGTGTVPYSAPFLFDITGPWR